MAGKAFQWAWRGKLCSGHRRIISFTGIPTADPGHGIGRFALATLECALSGHREVTDLARSRAMDEVATR